MNSYLSLSENNSSQLITTNIKLFFMKYKNYINEKKEDLFWWYQNASLIIEIIKTSNKARY